MTEDTRPAPLTQADCDLQVFVAAAAVRETSPETCVGEGQQDVAQHARDIEVTERCEQQVLEQAGMPPVRDIYRDRLV